MKQRKRSFATEAVILAAGILLLTGCGEKEVESPRTEIAEAQLDVPQVKGLTNDGEEQSETQEAGTGENQDAEINVIEIRQYSDQEKERMKKLQASYQDETAKPENMIQEVDSAEDVTEGTLCYITSTGQFYLPDRELTDEEMLEIIDCNFRIALNTGHKTQEEWDAEDLARRTELEEKVKAAGGISEEKAVEIARKAMETDLGEEAKELKLCVDETFGWSSDLCVADWSEIKEKDKGALAYSVGFNNAKTVTEIENLLNYNCTVNAVDGSILEAYVIKGWGDTVRYEH